MERGWRHRAIGGLLGAGNPARTHTEESAMRTVPRPAWRAAAGPAVALLLLGPALGACVSTVAGRAAPDAAVGAGLTPGAGPGSTAPADPTGTAGPSDQPSGEPTDSPTDSPGGSGAPTADQQTIAGIAETFYHGVAVKDGRRVCALMTEAAQRSAAEDGKDCPGSLAAVDLSDEQVSALSAVEVDPGKIEVTGDRAEVPAAATTVHGASTDETGDMKLVRQGGSWKIDDIT